MQVVALEFLLHVGADVIFQPCMVCRGANAPALQTRGGVLHFRTTVTVNNPGFTTLFLHVTHQLIERFKLLHQHVANVRTVKTADLD
ncbi:hypothetical protein SDC9_147687 [bioreactor metagenome]|uniref:Uncharacterized protein n=1 Tax=bioreactor metagenome TaxID=1076179 RepID=A0A645EGT7_9ZZZZ